jgi:hypothetical protein
MTALRSFIKPACFLKQQQACADRVGEFPISFYGTVLLVNPMRLE